MFSNCNRIKRKGTKALDDTKSVIREKQADAEDKIIARFDAVQPDTRFNKRRFAEFFGFDPPPDVQELYCYADEMGIDHDYQFAFTCDTSTLTKIIGKLELNNRGIIGNNSGQGFWHSFPWWDSTTIARLVPYSKKGEHETYFYLRYDTSKQKAYYFTFDM